MWISPRMVKVCICSRSFRIGCERSKICLLSVFQIYLWRGPCETMFGSSQRSNCPIFHIFMENVLLESARRLPPNSRKTSARAEDPIITVSKRRWHRRNVRTNYFRKQMLNAITQTFSKQIISTFSAFRHYPSFPIEVTRRGTGESRGGMSVGQQNRFIEEESLGR